MASHATPAAGLRDRPIRISAYDSDWPLRFERERAALEEVIGELAPGGIHHVGSTAVPGVDAEPVIDILVGVEKGATAELCYERLAGLDYLRSELSPERLCKPCPEERDYEVRITEINADDFRQTLAFRDFLRSDPQAAIGFAAMKREFAKRCATDRQTYMAAKSEVIQAVVGHLAQRSGSASGRI